MLFMLQAKVALVEWLTRCPAILPGNPFGGVGSNPAGDAIKIFFKNFEVGMYIQSVNKPIIIFFRTSYLGEGRRGKKTIDAQTIHHRSHL